MNNKLIKEKQDLTHLSWSVFRQSSGTAGSFLKSYSELGGRKTYYKLSNFDQQRGVVGHECVNELIADRLLTILGIPHLEYRLIHADVLVDGRSHSVYLCASEDFKAPGETKTALDVYKKAESTEEESVLEFCVRMGWEEQIYQMLLVDFLILNRDRHGANIEVLRNSRRRTLRLAPLYDHGLSLLCRCSGEEEIRAFDVLEDRPCNNAIGSRSVRENLKLIPADRRPKVQPLRPEHKVLLLAGLDGVISETLQEKIWEMIWKRWCIYEDLCNS